MDNVLKLVYDNWTDHNFPLPNGRHPLINQMLKDDMRNNKRINWAESQDYIQNIVKNNVFVFDHSNFWGHFKETYSKESFVRVEDVNDDNCVYVWPIEVRTIMNTVYKPIEFTVNEKKVSYTIIDTISPELLKLMQQGKVKIAINLSHDPIDRFDDLELIEQYFNEYNIDGSNIIIVPGNDLRTEQVKYYSHGKLKIIPAVLMVTQQFAKTMLSYPIETSLGYTSDMVRESDLDDTTIRPKRFLCFNRSMRPHRYMMAYYALKHNLLENSTFSFLNQDMNPQNISTVINQFNPLEENKHEYAQRIHDLIPYELDTQHLSRDERQGFSISNNRKDLYSNTYFHLTVETRFDKGETPFISEKTWRPVVNLQPFIMIGNVGTLKYLKELGFKTFSPFIDESYDLEIDPITRFSMIENEIKKLNDMPIEELHKWYYSITDILLYNQKHLATFANLNSYEFVFNEIKRIYQ